MELILRRRDQALQLYEAEHHFAEGLQRHLLPEIPSVGGLDMAARYVAAGSDQQVVAGQSVDTSAEEMTSPSSWCAIWGEVV